MSNPSRPGRGPTAAPLAVLGAILAGTAFFVVPTLALAGRTLAAAVAAIVWIGGLGILWMFYRRDLMDADARLARERQAHSLYRGLVEHGAEVHLVLDAGGKIGFASPNIQAVLGGDPQQLESNGGLIDLVDPSDRRRVLRMWARVRRNPGRTEEAEVRGWRSDGTDCHCDVRAVNLLDSEHVQGVLFTLRDITPRKTLESEIQHLAYYDPLTGLANRRFFFEQGAKALSLARRHQGAAAVFYLDLDGFSQLTDEVGHEEGDALLQAVADGLRKSLRDADVVARLGSDEFGVILTAVRNEDAAGRVAHRIVANMPSSAMVEGHEVVAGVSIGVAMFPEDADDLEALLRAADVAMYRAKAENVGVQFYRPELRTALTERLRLEQDLRHGLEHHEFHLHYQPVFHVLTGRMAGAEALSRWRHFTRGSVPAAQFIELAERSGLILSLDRWAMARAIHQRQARLEDAWIGWVSVNLSPQSVGDPGLPEYIRELLRSAQLEPGSLVVEVPESAVLYNPEGATDLMWDIKNAGAAIALDDFGMASTSFGALKRLPIDILKLHPAFVHGIGRDEGDEHLIDATISIGHGIGAKVLAKGVERASQLEWLREAGCDLVQGYFVGAPVPAEDIGAARPRMTDRRPGAA